MTFEFLSGHKHGKLEKIWEFEKLSKSQGKLRWVWFCGTNVENLEM